MLELLCFDICAIAILITLYFAMKSKGLGADKAGRRLSVLVYVTIISALVDVVVNIINRNGRGYAAMGYILIAVYNILHNAMLFIFVSYIIALIGTWHRVGTSFIKSVRLVPCYITAICSAIAPMGKLFYGYDSKGTFLRYPFFVVFLVLNGIYVGYAIYFTVKNIDIIGRRKAIALSLCAVAYLIEGYVQLNYPYLVISTLGFTLSLMVIVMFVDNPEDTTEEVSGLMSNSAYLNDLKVNFYSRKPFDIVHINIRNNKLIDEMLSYERYSTMIASLGSELCNLNTRLKLDGGLYYIGDGSFRAVADYNDFDRTMEFAKATLELFNGAVCSEESKINIEASVNVTQCPADFNTLEDLLSFKYTADKYEYIGLITTSKDIIEKDSLSIGNNVDKLVEKAIVNNSIRLFYQPLYDVKKDEFSFAEAVIKIVDDELGIIEPEIFMPAAERNGSVNEIGFHSIEEICRLLVSEEFADSGIKAMGIHISAVQFLQKNLADRILSITDKFKVSPSRICFEITESVAVDNQKLFEDNLVKLSERGFGFALNNYGTGYSNIINLASMPINIIRFDKSLIEVDQNSKLQVILDNSVEMIKALNKTIIIDGIKTKEMEKRFIAMGCEYLQGEYYSKFLDAADFLRFLKNAKEKKDALR